MRTLCIVLLAFTASHAAAQQPASAEVASPSKLLIPAQLSKTVRADKARPGDPVEFRTLEAVLVEKSLVMPADTRLFGRVLSAGAKQDNKNSWLAVVVDRAEWKEHKVSLRAFIAAQITLTGQKNQLAASASPTNDTTAPNRRARQPARNAAMTDPSLSGMVRPPLDANQTTQDESGLKHPWLENIGIIRDKDGTTYLLSSKANVTLPGGVLLMLRNEAVATPATTEGQPPSTTSPQP
jgi:hypothetical protein